MTGPDVALGTFTVTAAIDPATGNFSAPLASSGRFFGPQGTEIGMSFGAR